MLHLQNYCVIKQHSFIQNIDKINTTPVNKIRYYPPKCNALVYVIEPYIIVFCNLKK